MDIKPKISFVIAARNDDYGGNFLNRIGTFVRVLIHQTNKYKVLLELIIVEYNPPVDNPPLSEVLPIKNNKYLPVRIITVSNEFHQKVAQGSKNPFLEYTAKNIGIRWAKGEYVLSTNSDIVFPKEFIKFLAEGQLEENKFYRVNRHDLPAHIFNENMPVPEILDWCHDNVVRVMTNNGTLFFNNKRWLKRFIKSPTPSHLLRLPIFNFITKIRAKFRLNQPHTAAAGDFMLAHSKAWQSVKGFSQTPFSSNIDSHNLFMFLRRGLKQEIIQLPIYHIGHKPPSGNRKKLDLKAYHKATAKMSKTEIPYQENLPDWGFPNINFEEKIISA
ncbi:MAG: glycosyltransferase [Parcubacteria group bacterium]|nr:glycosyltransferase [Parcubacteria group bacterium]